MIYERDSDRHRQADVLTRYAGPRRLSFQMRVTTDPWDADLYRDGKLVALAEVKVRAIPRSAFKTYKVDRDKVEGLLAAAEFRGVVPILLVGFLDGVYRLVLSRAWLGAFSAVSTIHRTDRQDSNDFDYVYEWSNDLWAKVA